MIAAVFGLLAAGAAWAVAHTVGESAAGPAAVAAWRGRADRRRLRRSAGQWPQALLFLAGAVASGASVEEGLDLLKASAPEPLRTCLAAAGGPGTPVKARLGRLLNDPSLRFARAALLVFVESGGRVGRLLQTAAEIIQRRKEAEDRVAALTAQARASAWIIALAPAVIASGLFFLSPDFLEPLTGSPAGRALLLIAGLMSAAGLALALRLSRVEM